MGLKLRGIKMSTFNVFSLSFIVVCCFFIGYILYKAFKLPPKNLLYKDVLKNFKEYRPKD